MSWEAVNDVHATESDLGGMGDEEGKTMCGNSEMIANVALWVPNAKNLYSAVLKE